MGGGRAARAPLPLPLQPMLVNEAWQRIDTAAAGRPPGAIELESFFIGQVVGSFRAVRPAGEITRQLAADCEQRIADWPGGARADAATTAPAG